MLFGVAKILINFEKKKFPSVKKVLKSSSYVEMAVTMVYHVWSAVVDWCASPPIVCPTAMVARIVVMSAIIIVMNPATAVIIRRAISDNDSNIVTIIDIIWRDA